MSGEGRQREGRQQHTKAPQSTEAMAERIEAQHTETGHGGDE